MTEVCGRRSAAAPRNVRDQCQGFARCADLPPSRVLLAPNDSTTGTTLTSDPEDSHHSSSPAAQSRPRAGSRSGDAQRLLDPDRLGDHIDRLYRAAWGLCGSRHDAEDLVQETLLSVLKRPRVLRRDDDPGYLLRTRNNTYAN